MADARDSETWSFHADQLIADFGKEPPGHINVPQLIKWARNYYGRGKVLDFGCGVGLWRGIFEGLDYTGCDQNEKMVELARQKWPEDRFVLHGWDQLPFFDEEFDLLFTRSVLMHNTNEDKKNLLPELVRVLKPGGFYIASESTYTPEIFAERFPGQEWDPYYTDGYAFSAAGWAQELEKYGLGLWNHVEPKAYLFVKLFPV